MSNNTQHDLSNEIYVVNKNDKILLIPDLISNMRTQIAVVKIYNYIRSKYNIKIIRL